MPRWRLEFQLKYLPAVVPLQLEVARRHGYNLGAVRDILGESAYEGCRRREDLSVHWRGTVGFSWIRGNQDDFLGQYRRNSHFTVALRYSF